MTVASIMASLPSCVGRIASGMGKTFVVIALARYHVNQKQKVVIVLANELLYDQFMLDRDIYLSDIMDSVTVKLITRLKTSDCNGRVVICDEFDDMIDTSPVLFKQNPNKSIEYGGMLATISA